MAGRLSRLVLNLRRNIPPGTPLEEIMCAASSAGAPLISKT